MAFPPAPAPAPVNYGPAKDEGQKDLEFLVKQLIAQGTPPNEAYEYAKQTLRTYGLNPQVRAERLREERGVAAESQNSDLINQISAMRDRELSTINSLHVAGVDEETRKKQLAMMQMFQAQAAGDKNSVAQQQLQESYRQAAAQQKALASSMRGAGGGAALRSGMQGAANVRRGLAGESDVLMMQEQQAANSAMSALSQQMRDQDTEYAGLLSDMELKKRALTDETSRFYDNIMSQYATTELSRGLRDTATRAGVDRQLRDINDARMQRYIDMGATAAQTGMNLFNNNSKK